MTYPKAAQLQLFLIAVKHFQHFFKTICGSSPGPGVLIYHIAYLGGSPVHLN